MSDGFSITEFICIEYSGTQTNFPLEDTAFLSVSSQWKLMEKNMSKTIFLT